MATVNDGAIPFGTRVLTINTRAFVAESVDLTRPSQFVARYSNQNAPAGGVQTDDIPTGTATLQLSSTVATPPLLGETFSENFNGAAAETWYVSDVGQPEEKGADKKVRISFRKKFN